MLFSRSRQRKTKSLNFETLFLIIRLKTLSELKHLSNFIIKSHEKTLVMVSENVLKNKTKSVLFCNFVVAKLRKFKKKTHFLINRKNVTNSEQVS